MGKRVLDLPSVTTLLGTDVLYAVRPTEASITNYDKKITWADLLAQITLGSVSWGSITGTLSAQADLQLALDSKLDKTFASPQTLTYGSESTYQFLGDGKFSVTDTASGNELRLDALNSAVLFKNNTLQVPSGIALRTWEFPDASGTIALTSALGDYIKKDGTTPTTATIPFAQGASFGGATTFNDVATFNYATQQTLGFQINPPVGSPDYITSAGTGYLEIWAVGKDLDLHTDDDLIYRATNYHKWDGGIPGSTAKYQFGAGDSALNGKARFYATTTETGWIGFDSGALNVVSVGTALTLTSATTLNYNAVNNHRFRWNGTATPPTGTQAYLLAIDSNGNLIQGSAGSGFVTLSGHNDLTTPWSIGDASTWNTSSAGMRIDPVGAYGVEIKGNVQIEQAVSQALNLYRPVASGDICLNFRAWDSLGTASDYAQICGRIVNNTAGSLAGALDFEVMVNGTMQTPMILSNTGTVLSLHTSVSGSQISLRSSDTGAGGWRIGVRSTTAGEFILVNDNLSTIPLIVSRTDDSFTFAGAITAVPSTSATPALNGQMTFERTSNTQLKIKVRGTDGVVRQASLTLS